MKYLSSFLICLIFTHCTNSGNTEQPDHRPTVFAEPDAPEESGTLPTINPDLETDLAGSDRFQHYQSIQVNLDEDDDMETLYITADAEIDDRGRVGWSDGNVWEVYAEYGDDRRFLYVQDLPMGKLLLHHNQAGDIYLEEAGPHTRRTYRYQQDSFKEVDHIPANLTTIDLTKD